MIRARLIRSGIADPLTALPDMHAVLDVVEDILSENRPEKDLVSLHMTLYRPEPGEQVFDVAETDPSFDAFMEAVGDLQ